jgi:hypothetical protein
MANAGGRGGIYDSEICLLPILLSVTGFFGHCRRLEQQSKHKVSIMDSKPNHIKYCMYISTMKMGWSTGT